MLSPTFIINEKTFSGINAFLSYMKTLSTGTYGVDVLASGYETMTKIKIAVPGNLSGMTINLVPLVKAHDCPRNPRNSKGFMLCGYVSDQDHNALVGVQVSSSNFSSVSTVTDVDGYYEVEFLPVVVAPNTSYDCGDLITFIYKKPEYKIHSFIYDGIYIYQNGDSGNMVTLTIGTGSDQKRIQHRMCP